MVNCSLCRREAHVELEGTAVIDGKSEVDVKVELCFDHLNRLMEGFRKFCPVCSAASPVEMEYDTLVGDEEYWYCPNCDNEFRYRRGDL